MTKHYRIALAIVMLGVCVSFVAHAQPKAEQKSPQWLTVRGNAQQTGVVAAALPDKLEVVWTFKAQDAFEGAAAIVNGVVYIGNYDEQLYAIDLNTGREKWKYKMGPTKATPAVMGDSVYVGDEDGVLHCVNAANGKKRWTFETKGEITSSANFFKGKIIVSSWDNTLYCLTKDGKKAWSIDTEGPVNGSPAVAGDLTFVAGCDSTLHAIDLNTGKETASLELGGQAASTPAILGDHLFVGTMEAQVLGIDWKKNKIDWTFEARQRAQAYFASAAATDSIIVIGSRDRKIYGIHRATGKKAWEFATDRRVDPSPVVAGKRVYAPSMDGNLYVLDLKTGKEIRRHRLGRRIIGSPSVADGRLILGTAEGVLYCLGKK